MAESSAPPRPLPAGPLVIGYCNWGQAAGEGGDKIVQAVRDGLNVVIFFSINLADVDGQPVFTGPATGSVYFDAVAETVQRIRALNPAVACLISIGGWNSPHPSTAFSGESWWAAFKEWNATEVARPALGWGGFDGIDWDIEGHDDGEAAGHGNVFTVEVLDLMGAMSVAAKRDGFTVTMAPSQSYLDPCTREFSRDTNFPPLEPWHEDFHYAGRNLYAYLVARFGAATFDLISVQLYEGWSSANHRITEGEAPAACLQRITQELLAGWEVDFSTDPEPRVAALGAVRIEIARQQLVIGLANGWCSNAKPDKFLLVWPEDVGGKKTALLSHLYIKINILPRQARDKHRENSKKVPFSKRRTRR
jgi:chitinase